MARRRAAIGTVEQGTLGNVANEGNFDIVPPVRDPQGTFDTGECVKPVASTSEPKFFPNSLSVSAPDILELQSGGNV